MIIHFTNFGVHNNWFLWMHSSFSYYSSYDWNGINLSKSFEYTFTYAVQSYQLLESPYSTDCNNYRETTTFLSREECVRKCRIRESLSKCGVISYETDVIRGEPNVRFSGKPEEEECIERLYLKKYCYDMCPKDDCLIDHYKQIEIAKYGAINQDEMTVAIFFSSEPETSYHHKPSVPLIEFLCYLASTIALWFGVSMFSIIFYLKSINFEKIISLIKCSRFE